MSEDMFFDPGVDWRPLKPYHMLVLRACAPANVFTITAKSGYLIRVGGIPELSEIANAIFTSDYEFVTNLPSRWKEFQPQLVTLIHLVYRSNIRPTDPRVKAM